MQYYSTFSVETRNQEINLRGSDQHLKIGIEWNKKHLQDRMVTKLG